MPAATKESFARALEALVRKYEADRDTYLSSQYNEAQTRTQFISPLLDALGWDVRNEAGVPYNLCEVLEEKGETHGRPDYTFRINGQTKFFLASDFARISFASGCFTLSENLVGPFAMTG
ncbi:MAG: hypothetical protein ACRD33_03200 [Candidatus Acidiferrales bacterium]